MKIELVVKDIEQVPEDLRENYVPDDSGAYRLAIAANDEGQLENVAALKKALDTERKTRREYKQELATLKDSLGDADAATLKSQLTEAETALTSMKTALADAVAKSAIKDAIAKARGVPEVLEPVLRQFLKANPDGTVRVLDSSGAVRVDESGEPLTVDALLAELRERPEYGSVFLANGNSGSGASGTGEHTRRAGATSASRRSKMGSEEKVAYISQHGREAYLRLPF